MNTQAVEPSLPAGADGAVEVFETFYTIQGEGPFAGRPAVFVRLAGCTLRCPLCDTDYTSKRKLMAPADVTKKAEELWGRRWEGRLAVITGGEPFRQDLRELVLELDASGFHTQVETNGQLYRPGFPYNRTTVVCSPKLSFVHEELKKSRRVHSLKYVVDAEHISPEDGLPTEVLGMKAPPCRPWPGFKGEVYVQPADEGNHDKNKANVRAAVDSCMRYGYRLCLQTHKLVGLP